jgi:hypothetical protein
MNHLPCPTCGRDHIANLTALDEDWNAASEGRSFCCCSCCAWVEAALDTEFARLVAKLTADGADVSDIIAEWPQ